MPPSKFLKDAENEKAAVISRLEFIGRYWWTWFVPVAVGNAMKQAIGICTLSSDWASQPVLKSVDQYKVSPTHGFSCVFVQFAYELRLYFFLVHIGQRHVYILAGA